MKKNFKYFAIVWIVGVIIFNAITFLTPNEVFGITRFDKSVFWIAYALVTLSFIAELITAYVFIKDDNKEKIFLKIPLLKTGYTAVIVSVIVGLIFMVFSMIPWWIGTIVCLLVAGYFLIACLNAYTAANVVVDIDKNVKSKTSFIKQAIVDAENIMARTETQEMKAECKKVYDALRYSDPMSAAALNDIERQIERELNELKQVVIVKDNAKITGTVNELLMSIKERNNLCKALK